MGTDERAKTFAQALAGVAVLSSSALAAEPFASRAEAEAFLARALPEATAANPRYKDPSGDTSTRWLTRSVTFRKDEGDGTVVVMREDILKYRGDARIGEGSHDAEVPLDITGVGLISEAWAPVDNLDDAAGILFKCPKGPCIKSSRDGKASIDEQTDITISDPAARAKLYAAFRALLKGSGLP